MSSSGIEIVECTTPQQRDEFIFFQWVPYQRNPYWVPPLISERREFYDKTRHPFHQHAEVAMFIAKRGGQPVGTIYATDNQRHNEFHHENVGMFGGFECINDQAVAAALFDRAAQWLKARGRNAIRGPFNFSTNEESGLLIDAFDDVPRLMMTYNPPYYQQLIECAGFAKAMDLYAYRKDVSQIRSMEAFPEKLQRVTEKVMQHRQITIRKMNMKHFDEEVNRVKVIYNAAWARNWGFVPMTEAEFEHLAKGLKMVLDPDFIFIVEAKGEPVGFGLTIPDVNEPLRRAYPRPGVPEWWTLIKFFYNMKFRKVMKYVRVLVLGVLPEYRVTGIDGLLYVKSAEEAMKKGYYLGEFSWILENNYPMRNALEKMGSEIYKTYRVYEKPL
jgi:GNAT superfamily N-acetyltransferase